MSKIASRAPIPRRRAVSTTERTSAWRLAPQTERKQLVTLRNTALHRTACSDALLVGGTSGSVRKTKRLCCHYTRLRRNVSTTAFSPIGGVIIAGLFIDASKPLFPVRDVDGHGPADGAK